MEKSLERPVITSNQVVIWETLRLLGSESRYIGFIIIVACMAILFFFQFYRTDATYTQRLLTFLSALSGIALLAVTTSPLENPLRLLAARRWNAWALNFRGCSGEPNRVAASYSSGDTRDLAFLVPQLTGPRFAIGFSLGASVVLNGLARLGVPLDAAVAVSAPFQLATSAKAIDAKGGFGPVYLNHFLPSLKRKALEAAPRFSSVLDAEAITAVKTIRDFDHHVTARVFGFSSAEDYYARCSTAAVLGDIRTP
jgi:pimeloyl-ACP methyl ester carboxylesterase